jgi:hypothetical protein
VPETVNAAAAINQLVEDTTQSKFESTSNAQDEVVLLNIVQVGGVVCCARHSAAAAARGKQTV